jgi:soluble lytic murein transglycosylase
MRCPLPLRASPRGDTGRRGRSAIAGRNDDANALYSVLAQEFHFYGLLAAEALGRLPSPAASPAPEPQRQNRPLHNSRRSARAPGVQRTVKLAGLDMRPESLREWVYVIRGLDDDGLLLAAEYARSQGLYDRAINTAERTVARHDFSLRYLMPYRDHFAAAAREQAVDPAILLGLARQESRFALDIVSSAGQWV